MSIQVPDEPERYFRDFLPEQFRAHRSRFPPGDTAADTRFRLEGGGAWCLRVAGGELSVIPDDDAQVAMELACTPDDFRALFVDYLRAQIRRDGRLSEGPLSALRPLVLTRRKHAVCQRTRRSLALELTHDRAPRVLVVTPGGGPATAPACRVRMSFADYLQIQTGRRSTKRLFLTRRLKIKGDITHALRLDPLLG